MQNYNLLENEHLPEILKNKPRWMFCGIIALGLLLLIISAILLGVFIGYMYCFLEQRTGKVTQTANFEILRLPLQRLNSTTKRTINEALVSNVLVSRILKLGRAIIEDEFNFLQWSNKGNKSEDLKMFL